MNLFEWIQHPKNLEAYQTWINDPITKTILLGLRSMNYVNRLPEPNGDRALQELGFRAGRHSVPNVLEGLPEYHAESETSKAEDSARLASYLIKVEGYSREEALKLIQTNYDSLLDELQQD